MNSRRFDFHGEDAARGLDLLEQRIVVLEEERLELGLMAPLALVVVLDGVGLIRADLRRRALGLERGGKGSGEENGENGEQNPAHGASLKRMVALYREGAGIRDREAGAESRHRQRIHATLLRSGVFALRRRSQVPDGSAPREACSPARRWAWAAWR